ncbi:hypothetical protein [Geosporobacter subterraneus]|nr:hypothetical protein [Geosporobacter subterraneus]
MARCEYVSVERCSPLQMIYLLIDINLQRTVVRADDGADQQNRRVLM